MKTTCKDSAQIARVWYGRCLSLEALEGEHGWGWYFGQRPNLRKSAQCDKDQALHDTLAKFAKEDGFTLPTENTVVRLVVQGGPICTTCRAEQPELTT